MFGLFQKKKKSDIILTPPPAPPKPPIEEKEEKTTEPIKKVKDQKVKDVKKKNSSKLRFGKTKTYTPSFGTVNEFESAYCQGEKNIKIGENAGKEIYASIDCGAANDIVLIDDDPISAAQQFVIPVIKSGKLSYVIYDPDGSYYGALAPMMMSKGYDMQVIDLEDEQHPSRIDLFEIVNITYNTYWTSLILSGSIKCDASEVLPAHNLFMAMMQYLLDKKQAVNIVDMRNIFDNVCSNDADTMRQLEQCDASKAYINKYNKAQPKIKVSVLKKMLERFFKPMEPKLKLPNVFTVAMPQKKTALFIKSVPSQYKSLMTAMLFNLKASSVLCGDGSANTIIIDTSNGEWYHQALLDKACSEAGSIMNNGVGTISVRKTIGAVNIGNNLLIYAHTSDEETKKIVYDCLAVEKQLNTEELVAMQQKYFGGDEAPEEVLQSAPIAIEDLDNMNDCIVIDTSHKIKAFRCERSV